EQEKRRGRRRRGHGEELGDDRPAEEEAGEEQPAGLLASRRDLAGRGRDQEGRRPVHVGPAHLEDRRRKRDERQEGERGGPTCPEPAREREDRSERPEADEELEEAGAPQPAEEKPEGEEVLLVVPQEALRREAGDRLDGPVEREVARLREVIGQSVEREVGRQGADPRRGEEEK